MTHECPKCKKSSELKDMNMKMGGLLCPGCRRIMFSPYVDKEYFEEYSRRKNLQEKEDNENAKN